jgi:hypothetical protein
MIYDYAAGQREVIGSEVDLVEALCGDCEEVYHLDLDPGTFFFNEPQN